jgi:hypothetical protein
VSAKPRVTRLQALESVARALAARVEVLEDANQITATVIAGLSEDARKLRDELRELRRDAGDVIARGRRC